MVIGVGYSYFSHGISSEAVGTLTSSNGEKQTSKVASSSLNNKISLDTAFLSSLITLNTIKIDNSLFSNQAFQALRDNSVTLEQVAAGRIDPFAPIEGMVAQKGVTAITTDTNEPSQLTTRTAILNGVVSTTTGVTATYFEYGPTPSLGQATQIVQQSLVGTFMKKISGLSSGTVYFYRAAAKVNGAIIYGEVISFNTK